MQGNRQSAHFRDTPVVLAATMAAIAALAFLGWQHLNLNRARPGITAWQRSYVNLKMIGDMCGLYDSEFNHLPTALGELGPTEDIDLHDFLYPFYHDEVPVPVHPTTQEAINWVDKNGDYVYLGAGRPMSAFAGNEVLAYNKFKYAGKEQMVNVLFADGRVERIPCPDLLTRLRLKPTTAPSRGAAN